MKAPLAIHFRCGVPVPDDAPDLDGEGRATGAAGEGQRSPLGMPLATLLLLNVPMNAFVFAL